MNCKLYRTQQSEYFGVINLLYFKDQNLCIINYKTNTATLTLMNSIKSTTSQQI